MGLFRAMGFLLLIVGVSVLMPEVFSGMEQTLLKFFALASASMDTAMGALGNGGF